MKVTVESWQSEFEYKSSTDWLPLTSCFCHGTCLLANNCEQVIIMTTLNTLDYLMGWIILISIWFNSSNVAAKCDIAPWKVLLNLNFLRRIFGAPSLLIVFDEKHMSSIYRKAYA